MLLLLIKGHLENIVLGCLPLDTHFREDPPTPPQFEMGHLQTAW